MKIKKTVITKYENEDGFSFTFEPIEDTVKIVKTAEGYEARYLVRDDDAIPPDDMGDDGLFLVGYHRDFTVDRGQRELVRIYKEEDFKKDNGYDGRVYADGYGWKSYAEAKAQGLIDKMVRSGDYHAGISQELAQRIYNNGKDENGDICEEAKGYLKKYHIFGLDAYIHSGVTLSLGGEGRQCRWDTSKLGLVFVSKKEWTTRKKAEAVARSLIKEWNCYLSGDTYIIVKETYNNEKESCSHDSVGGFNGYDYALKALATDI
jgi:hypothetical protein